MQWGASHVYCTSHNWKEGTENVYSYILMMKLLLTLEYSGFKKHLLNHTTEVHYNDTISYSLSFRQVYDLPKITYPLASLPRPISSTAFLSLPHFPIPPHLPLGKEVCQHRSLHGIIEVSVIKDNQRRLPSKLQSDLLNILNKNNHAVRRQNKYGV